MLKANSFILLIRSGILGMSVLVSIVHSLIILFYLDIKQLGQVRATRSLPLSLCFIIQIYAGLNPQQEFKSRPFCHVPFPDPALTTR
jgi:hypothetical protein